MRNNKRNILLVIFLLLLVALAWYFLYCNKPISQKGFVKQGTTIIKGDASIKIWDYSAVDGDTIDFYFDGKLIYKTLGLQDTPTIYNTGHLSKGEHWIGIKAVTEGTNPPATTHFSIAADKENFEFDIDSWKDSASGSWVIKVE